MSATIIERQEESVTIQISIPLSRSMLDTEEAIQKTLNEAGVLASGEALKQFDTDGSPLVMGSTRWTSKGQEPMTYQTPYGEVVVPRHVYQTGYGGATFCPLERDARIVLTSTPRFAMQISHKYGEGPAARVVRDLTANHCRPVAESFVQNTAAAVAAVVQAKEEEWQYTTPKLNEPVSTIGMGVDGTCLFVVDDGKRQAMVGSISLYDSDGERHHTIYVAATPQYGKEKFYQRMTREIEHVRQLYPQARLTAVSDGSEDNWTFTRQFTKDECVDFYHASGYLDLMARAVHPRSPTARMAWVEDRRHKLRHEKGYAKKLLEEMQKLPTEGLSETVQEDLAKAITYFSNHHQQMNYAERAEAKLPIGSGVTEAACKTIVKMRMCRGGAKWKEDGAAGVLSLRTLIYTEERWEQFWAKVDRYGFPVVMAA
jgi:hypothetical protein